MAVAAAGNRVRTEAFSVSLGRRRRTSSCCVGGFGDIRSAPRTQTAAAAMLERSASNRFRTMLSTRENDDGGAGDSGRYGDLIRVYDYLDLIEYYNETKRILLRQGGSAGAGEGVGTHATRPFAIRHLEPRHRKSMIRCVLNHRTDGTGSERNSRMGSMPSTATLAGATMPAIATRAEPDTMAAADGKKPKPSPIAYMSKAEFKHRLRLVERRERWKMTRRLLFGDVVSGDDISTNGDDNAYSKKIPRWWESGIITEEEAPGFLSGIKDYENSLVAPKDGFTTKTFDEDSDYPKKMLSRMARGRTFKGDFRALLEAFCIAADAVDTDATGSNDAGGVNGRGSHDNGVADARKDLIPLYERIIGEGGGVKQKSKTSDKKYEDGLHLLRLFIDELETSDLASPKASPEASLESSDDEAGAARTEQVTPLVVGTEKILLMRKICDLDVFHSSPPPPRKSSSSPTVDDVFAPDDGGRSVGKRGERDLVAYLAEKENERRTKATTTETKLSPPPTMVLSPVWVRPKRKNRANTKQKCRYVLEIPTTKATGEKATNDGGSVVSLGTTSEFDAMVVRVIGDDGNHDREHELDCESDGDGTNQNEDSRPIMAIQEVWDAKATLDPAALLDVLNKKVPSLQKILHENFRVANLTDPCFLVREDGTRIVATTKEHNGKITDGVNFVVLPFGKDEKKDPCRNKSNETTTNGSSPLIYRVGIEATDNNNNNNNEDRHRLFLPQIGVFASRIISPGAAARRIQTVVYERLLETDIETVKDVVRKNSHGNKDDCSSGAVEDYGALGINIDVDAASRCGRPVVDDSLQIVEQVLELIDTVRPITVVGTLSSTD